MTLGPLGPTAKATLQVATNDVTLSQLSLWLWIDQHAKAQPVDSTSPARSANKVDPTRDLSAQSSQSVSTDSLADRQGSYPGMTPGDNPGVNPGDDIVFYIEARQLPQLMADLNSSENQRVTLQYDPRPATRHPPASPGQASPTTPESSTLPSKNALGENSRVTANDSLATKRSAEQERPEDPYHQGTPAPTTTRQPTHGFPHTLEHTDPAVDITQPLPHSATRPPYSSSVDDSLLIKVRVAFEPMLPSALPDREYDLRHAPRP